MLLVIGLYLVIADDLTLFGIQFNNGSGPANISGNLSGGQYTVNISLTNNSGTTLDWSNVTFSMGTTGIAFTNICQILSVNFSNATNTSVQCTNNTYELANQLGQGSGFIINATILYNGSYVNALNNVSGNITIDINASTVNLVGNGGTQNDTNTSNTSVSFNVTAKDDVDTTLLCNLTINTNVSLANFIVHNGSTAPNSTNVSKHALSDGTYYWNVTCYDDGYNWGTSPTWKFKVDNAGPGCSLTPSASKTVQLGATETIACSGTASGSPVTSTSVSVGGSSHCSGVGSCSKSYVFGTSGTKTVQCDVSSETKTNSCSITITVNTDGSTTPSGGGGGGGGAGTRQFDVDFTTTDKTTINKREGNIVSFTLDGVEKHEIFFSEVGATSVKLTIQSTPKDVILNVGELRNVDVDDNGIYDLAVTLREITSTGYAKVDVEKITETVPSEQISGVSEPEQAPIIKGEGEQGEVPVEEVSSDRTLLWIIIILVLIAVVIVAYYYTQKGGVGRSKAYRPRK